jgi:hypothetical protein
MSPNELGGNITNIKYTVSLSANPMVNMEVILDELTGDIIKGRGTGNLFISSGTSEPLSIRGRYEIEQGSYLFTFQSFFKKPFLIRPSGNNYIDWTGDPYDATIHFDALYTAENVSLAPLFDASAGFAGSNYASYREDINIVATLTGELFRPNIALRLELPQNSRLANNPEVAIRFQQVEKNETELNKQTASLIVFNSFAPYESLAATRNAFNELAYSTISGLLFGEVNKRLNQLLSKVLSQNNISFNVSGALYNPNLVSTNTKGFQNVQSALGISVGKSLFSDRLVLTFGSNFDIPISSDIQQNIQFLPDVTAQWRINKSGTIRASFFYRQNVDYLLNNGGNNIGQRTTRTGANISYRKEFDNIGKRNGKLKKSAAAVPVSDSTTTTQDSGKVNQ